jgi:hypothetical protein
MALFPISCTLADEGLPEIARVCYREQQLMHSPVPPMSCRQHHSLELQVTEGTEEEPLKTLALLIRVI